MLYLYKTLKKKMRFGEAHLKKDLRTVFTFLLGDKRG